MFKSQRHRLRESASRNLLRLQSTHIVPGVVVAAALPAAAAAATRAAAALDVECEEELLGGQPRRAEEQGQAHGGKQGQEVGLERGECSGISRGVYRDFESNED